MDLCAEVHHEYCEADPLLDPKFIIPLYQHFGSERVLLAVERGSDGRATGVFLLKDRGQGIWQIFLPSPAQIAPAIFGCGIPPTSIVAAWIN